MKDKIHNAFLKKFFNNEFTPLDVDLVTNDQLAIEVNSKNELSKIKKAKKNIQSIIGEGFVGGSNFVELILSSSNKIDKDYFNNLFISDDEPCKSIIDITSLDCHSFNDFSFEEIQSRKEQLLKKETLTKEEVSEFCTLILKEKEILRSLVSKLSEFAIIYISTLVKERSLSHLNRKFLFRKIIQFRFKNLDDVPLGLAS